MIRGEGPLAAPWLGDRLPHVGGQRGRGVGGDDSVRDLTASTRRVGYRSRSGSDSPQRVG